MAEETRFSGDALRRLKKNLRAEVGDEFAEASDHPGTCRCAKCLAWWAKMPDQGDDDFGPFTPEEVRAERVRLGLWAAP